MNRRLTTLEIILLIVFPFTGLLIAAIGGIEDGNPLA